jgi:cbb3-type cytochrome oxidase cytochrome c subunit
MVMKARFWVPGLLALLLVPSLRGKPLDVEADSLRPGLVAQYRSLADKDATLTRIDAKAAFHLGHSSPHPRIPAGPFEVVWTGVLDLKDASPIAFDAYLCGELTVEVDGIVVLQGRGQSETARVRSKKQLELEPGVYRLKISYRSLADLPARLQLWWQGSNFSREPLSAWHLKHLAADSPPALAQEQLAEKGRLAAERFGCARCHSGAFPGICAPPPGPSLADAGKRLNRAWLLDWLADPAKVRPDAHMPVLFSSDRKGFVERWLVAEYLLGPGDKPPAKETTGDHRMGRRYFVSNGCATCHYLPDAERSEQSAVERTPLTGLADRLPASELAAFLGNPHGRYPDGRMPRLPLTPDVARDIAAFLLLWSEPVKKAELKPPTAEEIQAVSRRLGGRVRETGANLLREKRCAECHSGLGQGIAANVPIADDKRGCLAGQSLPHYQVDAATWKAIAAYIAVAPREKHLSPFTSRQRMLDHLGCVHCHQRDTDRPPDIEAVGSTLGSAWLQNVPPQRTPRLTYPHQKYTRAHLLSTVREGVSGLRQSGYSYHMPSFGREDETILQALAEADGELPAAPDPQEAKPADPTLGSLAGPSIAGFQGYGCVSCHVWDGQMLAGPDPGAVGTDLTRVTGRIRRDWFDRFLEGPARFHPSTPMPTIFQKGQQSQLRSILDGDSGKQKEALWSYFALGKKAPTPKPPPPMPISSPAADEPPLVAQIPIRLPDNTVVESLCLLFSNHDLFVYDLGAGSLHTGYVGAQILRGVQGRLRGYTVSGTALASGFRADSPLRLLGAGKPELPIPRTLHGYDRLADGARLRWQVQFSQKSVEVVETLRLRQERNKRTLTQEVTITGIPAPHSIELNTRVPKAISVKAMVGEETATTKESVCRVVVVPDKRGNATVVIVFDLPDTKALPVVERPVLPDLGKIEGSLERPGYRAIAYPRPKTITGEDRVMPVALAAHPKDGRVFVASMKTGELFVVRDPNDNGKDARFDNYAHGLFQECLSMLADSEALYVLHRRNLTRIPHADTAADRFERVVGLPHGIADTYDYGYGLARDKSGAFIYTYAPYANATMPGSGSALRLVPGKKPQEVGFGFRNPLGWCSGPDGEVFFTDNQGEWVPTNKLCHLSEGRFYGFPNPAQREHTKKPAGKTAVWVPYGWAKSINGMAYDSSGGKFGPFAGQIFLAELMFGGAIVRANVEKVNGEYQGACFPFWGQGLLGPVTLAFDPKGRLWVGGITEPGWMAQPDRGALFRIDYTGKLPFEMKSIHVLPRGFRIVFTAPVAPATARDAASYRIEHYRYEVTGAYGSPELDRTHLPIERIEIAADGLSAELITTPLVKDRVYMIQAKGVKSAKGETLVHSTGAYTLNEIPAEKR